MTPTKLAKPLVLSVVAILIISFAYLLFSYLKHSQEAKINIFVLPEDSSILVDGKPVESGTVYLKPGSHTVSASREGFKTDSRDLDLVKKQALDIYLLPAPESEAAIKMIEDDPRLQAQRERYAGYNFSYTQSLIAKNYPILEFLPVRMLGVRIDYGVSEKYTYDPLKIAIYITAKPGDRQFALDWIKGKGIEPNSLEIIYKTP